MHWSSVNYSIVRPSGLIPLNLTYASYKRYRILQLASLPIPENMNTSHQCSKNSAGFQSTYSSIIVTP